MPVRIGLMSNAHVHAALYIPQLMAMPDVEFVGLADDDPIRAEEARTLFGATVFASYVELLATNLDAVIVTSENTRHREHIALAAAAGIKTILCEKPLATTVEDATAIAETCVTHDIRLMVAFPMRYSAPMLEVRQLMESGALGTVVGFEGINQGKLPANRRAWFIDPELVGGGAITDHTVHVLDAIRWMLGEEVTEVYAQSNAVVGSLETDLETSGLVVATFASGAVATIDCSWNRPMTYPSWGGLGIRVVGTNGVVDADAYAERITSYDDSADRISWLDCGTSAYDAMLLHFVRCVQGAADVSPTVSDGLESVRAIEAAYESARTGQPVAIRA